MATIEASGATLQEVVDDLERQHPGLSGRIVEGGAFRPEVFVAINGVEAFSLDAAVPAAAEVHILPAIAGGAAVCIPFVGKELRNCRGQAQLSQAQRAARVGTSQAHLSRIETGRLVPGSNCLPRYAAPSMRTSTSVYDCQGTRDCGVQRQLDGRWRQLEWPVENLVRRRGRKVVSDEEAPVQKDAEVLVLRRERAKGKTQEQAAARAGIVRIDHVGLLVDDVSRLLVDGRFMVRGLATLPPITLTKTNRGS